MGFFKRLFKRKPVEVPQQDEGEEFKIEKPKVINLEEAKKLSGWKKYKCTALTQEEYIVEARQFTVDDPVVDLGTARTEINSVVLIDKEGLATIFDPETFKGTYKEI